LSQAQAALSKGGAGHVGQRVGRCRGSGQEIEEFPLAICLTKKVSLANRPKITVFQKIIIQHPHNILLLNQLLSEAFLAPQHVCKEKSLYRIRE
jgi:hypothetical protein